MFQPTVRFIAILFSLLLALAPHSAAAAPGGLRLMMIEQTWCEWCERWDAEIAAVYPITDEGRAAPLVRHDIHTPLPAGVALERPARYTPTFVLLCGGQEVGRIEGYPGEDFFWGLLGRMLDDIEKAQGTTSDAGPSQKCDVQS
ncbi:MAG: thioredoxin family protein [Pseudomonadota bacterium]